MRRNAGKSFPTKQGKDLSSRARRRKRGSPGCVRDPRASSRVEIGLSLVHTWWESILSLNVKAVQGKQVPLEWTDISGDSWNGGTTLEFLSPFLWRAPPLEMRRNAGKSFPTKQGKDLSSRARRRKRGSPGCVRDPRASSRVEIGALDLRRGPQGPALVASGKASPYASSSGACRNCSPFDAGA
ncbi:hypothetical protein MJG53_018798 [Ovis ammon polii x Ovis aries]|uniref:Uncharacterized protein n=1 Tax=Ovis ammon polii x Ovis aries TaxID=2918886 RepID=A0ACB9U4Y2_9CETA|nr:hypothetical protein MJG53_018798 [Ovis ammon polii x Ovis aries]